jgi:hypothetical protein
MSIAYTASTYTGITDADFLGYDQAAREKWSDLDKLKPLSGGYRWASLDPESQRILTKYGLAARTHGFDPSDLGNAPGKFQNVLASISGEAQVFETKRENRGAVLKQGGVNVQTGVAGAEAVQNENLLSRNINQEIQGRIALNLSQAKEAQQSIGKNLGATIGQQEARAGQAGVDVGSGTTGVMATAASAKSATDKAAIEDYRIGQQNLLMGQGDAATKAAESLTGSINTQTADWAAKSTSAVGDVTANLLSNVETIVGTGYFEGDAQTQGVKDSQAAVGTTLDTWSLQSYQDVLDTLTSHSANKTTWDQMLLDQASTPTNPYSSYNEAIDPLTPVGGTPTNLLAAASEEQDISNVYTLSGSTSKSTSLI